MRTCVYAKSIGRVRRPAELKLLGSELRLQRMKAEECGGQVCCTEEMDYSTASKNKSSDKGAEKEEKRRYKKKGRDERKKKRVQIVIPTTVSASGPVGIGIIWCQLPFLAHATL